MTTTMLSYDYSMLMFSRVFIMKECCLLQKNLSISTEIFILFLSLTLYIICIIFIDLCIWNHLCIPGMKPRRALYNICS